MKSMIYFLIVLILTTVILSNELQGKKTSTEGNKFNSYLNFFQATGDIVGESFNFHGKGTVSAVAYGKGSNGGYALKDDSNYIKPQMVTKLPERMDAPKPGPLEVVDEVNKY